MANEIKLKIKVDDDGNLKIVGKNAEKAASGLEKTGKSARTADRNLKGAAKASANSSKNFSKLAQGISGGLVPAYATLAAQIFAISAAFNFLKSAGDLKSLQEGQIAYASATGVAMRTLTKDIIDATDAQVSFQDAASAGAIGTAAGLSTSQITGLGKAAKDASLILGRDVTDSFNRLVRGVTKAEPELLDELGIILRLEQASADYARTLGINAKDLTQFQKSQAVANDVLAQAESKYSRIIDIVDPGVNKFNQLGKAFDDIVNNIKSIAVDLATPLANLFIDVPELAYAGFILIGKGVLSAAIPALSQLGDTLEDVAKKSEESFRAAEADVKSYNRAIKAASGDKTAIRELKKQAKATAKAQLEAAGITKARKGSGLEAILGGKEATSRQLAGMKKAAMQGAGYYANMSQKMRRSFIGALDDMVVAQNASSGKIVAITQTTTQKISLAWAGMVTKVKGGLASLTAFAVTAGNFISKAFFWVQIAGLVFAAGKLAYDFFFKANEATEETATASSLLGEKIESLNEDYKNLVAVQKILLEDAPNSLNYFKTLGDVVNSLTSGELSLLVEQLQEVANTSFSSSIQQAQIDFDKYSKRVEQLSTSNEAGFGLIVGPSDAAGAVQGVIALAEAQRDQKRAQDAANESLLDFIMNSEENTEAQKNAAQFIQTQIDLLNSAEQANVKLSKSGQLYLNSLNDIAAGRAVDIKKLLEQRDAVAELSANIKELERLQKDNKDQFSDFVLSFAGESRESRILKNIRAEKELINKVLKEEGVGDEDGEKSKRLKKIESEEKLVTMILDKQYGIRRDTLALQVSSLKLARGATKGQASRLKIDQQIKQNSIAQREVELSIASIRQAAREDGNRALNEDETRSLEINKLKLSLLQEQSTELSRQLDLGIELEQTFKNSFESGFSSGLADLIKNNESSLRDSIAKLATSVLESIADVISKRITDSVVDLIFPVQKPADKIKEAHVEGAQIISDAIVSAHSTSAGGLNPGNVKVTDKGTVLTGTGAGLGQQDNRGILEKLLGKKTIGRVTSEGSDGVFAETEITRRTGGVFSGFINAFSDVFNKNVEGGFIAKFGAVFQEGGSLFGQLFQSILGIFSGGGGGFLSTIGTLVGGFFGMANGGYAKGGFRAFATGGMVNKPTLGLVGEGKYNEAIVPLPDGKSIPVMMKGGQSNNVVVNVNVDSNGNSQQNTQGDSGGLNLGNAIASAVQKELQNQKRSGGILNPYGAA